MIKFAARYLEAPYPGRLIARVYVFEAETRPQALAKLGAFVGDHPTVVGDSVEGPEPLEG